MTSIADFLQGDNTSTALIPAVTAAAKSDRELFFPPGEYHFYTEGCTGRYCHISNNDEGVKTIAMFLDGLDNFTVRGPDALLIFHGRISPLFAFNCRNITVDGLTVDFEDSFVSDADLVKRENGIAGFKFSGRHQVLNGKIVFTGDFYDNLNGRLTFYSYDRAKEELIFDSKAITVLNKNIEFKDGLIGLEDRFADARTDAFLVKHELRLCPGMVFDQCENVHVRNVTLHHAAGMGFLVQNCENCIIEGAVVAPRGRRASVSDDALHITDCRGKIRIENCTLSGTLDDSINVHGVFRKLKSRIPGGTMYYLETGHYQQQGVFNVRVGDVMRLFNRKSGKPYAQIRLTGVTPLNKSFIKIDFDEAELPETFIQGDPALILGTMAELEVVNTECKPLLGRGVLASGMKRIHISGCRFHTYGSGVFISGDWSFWYESGPVEDAVIEDNYFDNCTYAAFGATQEPLAVFPELASLTEDYYYHGCIKVRNNHFLSAKRPLVSMMSVANAEVTGNEYQPDDSYPFVPRLNAGYHFTSADSPMAAFLHCGNIKNENNKGFMP